MTQQAPPARHGVNASQVRVGDNRFANVLGFLQARFPAAPDWPARMEQGCVVNDQGQPLSPTDPCPAGLRLWYWRSPAPETRVPFELVVLHHCAHLVVVDKPHFLAATPGGRHLQETALVRLQHQLGIPTLAPMHRLDRDTAGVMAFSVQPGTRHAYQALWRDQAVHKVYEAIAPWRPDLALPLTLRSRLVESEGEGFMQMQVVAGEPNAETMIECIQLLGGSGLALYRLTPRTGRKHQLRAQMSALGLPIQGDRIYPHLQPAGADDHRRPLQLLARSMSFKDPVSNLLRRFESCRTLELKQLPAQACQMSQGAHRSRP